MSTIRPFPELLALAERESADRYNAWCRASASKGRGPWLAWPLLAAPDQGCETMAHLALLCDLSRWQSQRAAERLVAERVGLPVGGSAPGLFLLTDPEPVWWMDCISGDEAADARSRCAFHDSDTVVPCQDFETRRIPGIARITKPVEALVLICATLWPSQ